MPELDVLRTLGDQVVAAAARVAARDRSPPRPPASAAVLAAAAAAVVAVTATTAVLGPDDDPRPTPRRAAADRGAPDPPADVRRRRARSTTATGPSRPADRVVELDLTDEGVAFRTADGRIWFTDGGTTDEIGALGEPVEPPGDLESMDLELRSPIVRATGWIVSGNSGSLLSWFDFTGSGAPEVVVYDTAHPRQSSCGTGVDIPAGSWVGAALGDRGRRLLLPRPRPRRRRRDAAGAARPRHGRAGPGLAGGATWRMVASRPARSFRISHAEQRLRALRDHRGRPGTSSTCTAVGCGRWGCSRSRSRDGLTRRPARVPGPGRLSEHQPGLADRSGSTTTAW